MLIHRKYAARTVILALTVAAVRGKKPFVGFADDVERAWKKLLQKFGIHERMHKLRKHATRERSNSVVEETDIADRLKFRRGSDLGAKLEKFRNMDSASKSAETEDVFSKNWKPPKFDKNDPSYGRPKQGSLTEKRGIAAGNSIGKEIIQLCEVIAEEGDQNEDETYTVTFGRLFNVYQYISDKVVGMLLRARKHKLVFFEGEMLYQRRDEEVEITLLYSLEKVKEMYSKSNDPAKCLTNP